MLSQFDRQFLKRQIKILPSDFNKWNRQEFMRLLALLKLPETVQKQFAQVGLDNHTIKNLHSVTDKIEPSISQATYFPFHKLKSVLTLVSNIGEDDSNQSSVINKNCFQRNQEVHINQDNVISLKQSIDKLEDTLVIELTCEQIASLTRGCGLEAEALAIKKYNIDGFGLVCSLCDWDTVRDIRNYFKDEQIKMFLQMNCLFMTQYFRQQVNENRRRISMMKKLSATTENSSDQVMKDQVNQYIIEAFEISKKNSQDDIDLQQDNAESVLGNSQYGTSEVGASEVGVSEMGTSEVGTQEMGESHVSQLRDSVYAQSQQFGQSVRGSIDCRMSFRVGNNDNGRASMMYNSQILTELKDVCFYLPFDLLNLQSLQQIKLRPLKTAFGKEVDKDFWYYSVKGAKFGRDKQNDLRFPDELSISSKHAQIMFKSEAFYLQDLGSKTGTYIKIEKDMPIEEQLWVQFSTDCQILFKIIKKSPTEGMIKAEIKKPQNLPDYKITIKDKNKIKIGRSQRCHIRINSQSLAEKHSEVYYKDGTFYLKNCHPNYLSWLRLSPKSIVSPLFKLSVGNVFRLSSKKSFFVEQICNMLQK